ncbi:MAG: MlaA family lipoprotein [Gammaproteobacteria bacterium]
MTSKKMPKSLLVTLTLLLLTGFNSAFATNPKDPYEPFNRAIFNFNEVADRFILKPLATLYIKIVPKPLASGLSNVYSNLDNIPTVINDVLQGNFYQATSDLWRFGINSTIGVLGLFDVAQRMGLEPNYEDFGLTLARWGYKNSNYLVMPLLGPSTVRDTIAYPVNYYGMSIYPYIEPTSAQYGIYFGGVVVRRADIMRYEGVLQQMSFDKYAFMRDAYFQHRNYLIERNNQLGNPYLVKNNLLEESAVQENKDAEKKIKAANETRPFVNA